MAGETEGAQREIAQLAIVKARREAAAKLVAISWQQKDYVLFRSLLSVLKDSSNTLHCY